MARVQEVQPGAAAGTAGSCGPGSDPLTAPTAPWAPPAQVEICVKSVQRGMTLAQLLQEQNFPAIAIDRGMAQEER